MKECRIFEKLILGPGVARDTVRRIRYKEPWYQTKEIRFYACAESY